MIRGMCVATRFRVAGCVHASAAFRRRLIAVKTALRLLAGMGSLVPGNVALVGEPPGAHRASVGLLPCVGPLVLGCFALAAELLGAERAIKRDCFRGVDPLVLR